MSVKRAFFGIFQKLTLFCCAIFFGFTNAFSANLPSGYTELEYIESTGTQYIDTGVAPTATTSFLLEVEFEGSGNGYRFFGSGTNGVLAGFGTNSGNLYINDAVTPVMNNVSNLYNQKMIIDYHGKTVNINGTNYNCGQAVASSVNMYINARGDSLGTRVGAGKWYKVQISQNGALVRNFVPAKRNSDNVVGMYDTVNNVFYTNQGTGEFTAGPVVLNPCRNLANMIASNIDVGHYISNTGVYSRSVSNFLYNPYIPVTPNTTYTLTWGGNELYFVTISEYSTNSDSGFVRRNQGSSGNNTSLSITTGDTTHYVRFGSNLYGNNNTVTLEQVTALDWQLEQGSTATAYVPYNASCHNTNGIKIATTAYNAARFSPVVNDLNSTVATIRDIVTNTINQTAAIASLQADKQTRPEDACPAGKKCLLVETEENGVIVPHWYEIIESADD